MKKTMKHIYGISCVLVASLICSCSDLDRETPTTMDEEAIATEYGNLQGQVINLYTGMRDGHFLIDNAMMASLSDEAEYTLQGNAEVFNSGSWNQYVNPDDVWSHYFTYIRRVNTYLESTERYEVNLDAYKLDPSENTQQIYKTRLEDVANWKKEARFLRAYFYFELIKRYGGVPILTETLPLDADFSNITATGTVNFYYSDLTGANFTDAVLNYVNFYGLQSISAEQFYSTATYKNKTKANINFTDMDMSGWDLSGMSFGKGNFKNTNLKGANFMNTKIEIYSSSFSGNNDFTAADFRGSNMTLDRFKSTDTLKNTIMTDGTIQNFSMATAEDSFSIRKYVPLEGGEVISAKIAQSASISGGADLTLETGAYLEVVDGAVLTVENGSAITINTDGSTIFEIGENSGLAFADGSILEVNLEGTFSGAETYSFSFINAHDSSTISGLDELKGGENFLLSLNGELFDGQWEYFMEGNNFEIRVQVPEPATYAAVLGALAFAFAAYRRRK